MDHMSRVAFYESLWGVFVSIFCAVVLIICFAASLNTALLIGAHLALFFTVLTIRNAGQIARMGLEHERKPMRWTQYKPAVLMLQFAKAGAGIAASLYGASLMI